MAISSKRAKVVPIFGHRLGKFSVKTQKFAAKIAVTPSGKAGASREKFVRHRKAARCPEHQTNVESPD
jgi:hypothetical protein